MFECNNVPDDNTDLEIIDIVAGISKSTEEMYLSEVAEDIDFVPLETTDECVIGREPKLFFSDKYILVYDGQQKAIFLFDKNGKYLRKIGNRGQGPGEYLYPSHFDLSGDRLFIWDSDKMDMFCYDLTTGQWLHKKHYEYTNHDK
jgi:hypothetical protein